MIRMDSRVGRPGKILLLGMCVLLLQQVSIPYAFTYGSFPSANASLVHLHTGFLLAIAMLERDRVVVAGCFLVEGLGWLVRAHGEGYAMDTVLLLRMLLLVVIFYWTVVCARWLGWPRPRGENVVAPADVLRFALVGLLVFPVGYVAINAVRFWMSGFDSTDMFVSVLIQVYFAKQFGVAIVTLPVVVGWTERKRAKSVHWRQGVQMLLLGLALLASLLLSRLVYDGLDSVPQHALMDYRLVMLAIVGWCMLNLPMRVSMPMLSLVLLMMVHGLTGAAQYSGTIVGVFNLAHLGIEVVIVLTGLLFLTLSARDREDLQQRVVEDARRDSMTGLPNYNALRSQLDRRLGGEGQVGYLLLDQANALAVGFGLQAQAAVMAAVAARVAGVMRPYYLGNGQFALLPDAAGASEVAWESVLAGIERMDHRIDGRRVRIAPYLGVVTFGLTGTGDIEQALLSASTLAYEARHRNEVKPLYADIGQSTLRREQQRRLHDTADAIASLRDGRVLLHFQSIRRLDAALPSGGLRGEVLCRLLGEDGAVIPPSRFVDIIEASRRGPELDVAVVASVFRELRAQPGAIAHVESLSINLTGQSLSSQGFRERLEEMLARAPLPLHKLCFEITETAAIVSTDRAQHLLQSLRDMGCHVAIDDFGTGMQSFARLRDMPFDVIKIDGSFVGNMLHDKRDLEVVHASVAVAHACGAEVVAEFVENEAIAASLREMGVQWAQGYLYSKPEPLRDVLAAAARVR